MERIKALQWPVGWPLWLIAVTASSCTFRMPHGVQERPRAVTRQPAIQTPVLDPVVRKAGICRDFVRSSSHEFNDRRHLNIFSRFPTMTGSKDLPHLTSNYLKIFLRAQFLVKEQWPPASTDLSSKVAIVTGANTGLGFECVRQLLSFKLSRVILAVRSVEKGNAAAERLLDEFPKAIVDVWLLDMGSYQSVQAFGRRVEKELTRLDIAVLNAGVGKLKYDTVPGTGHEEIIQINYLSTVLLCILMLPTLRNKSLPGIPGRLLIVSSAVALTAKFPAANSSPLLPSFDNPKTFNPRHQYGLSKLLGHMFLYKLVDYVSADDVVVNMIEPGFTKGTELHRNVSGVLTAVLAMMHAVLGRTVQHSGTKYLDATIVKGKESHGYYLADYEMRP